jgi:hypothetical protein
MRKSIRTLATGLAFLALFVAGGCATAPPRPAMVPFAETGSYGFSETQLAPDRYEVRYVSPRLRTSSIDPEDSGEIEAQRQRSFDLALWRAAELATREGFPAFTVEQDNRNVAVTVRTEPVVSPFWPYHPFYGYDRFGRYYPGFPYYPYPYSTGYRSRASVQATAVLKVQMLEEQTGDSYDAAATAARLREAYGNATYPG